MGDDNHDQDSQDQAKRLGADSQRVFRHWSMHNNTIATLTASSETTAYLQIDRSGDVSSCRWDKRYSEVCPHAKNRRRKKFLYGAFLPILYCLWNMKYIYI
jgi:hypothetical protein